MRNWFWSGDQPDDGILDEKALYRNRPAKTALIVLLFVALIALILVLGGLRGGPSLSGSQTLDGTAKGHANSRTATQRAEDQTATRCSRVYATQQQTEDAAATAMAQWQVHVDAMNQLVSGAITLQQANQFWSQTRVGAQARLQGFAAADARLDQLTIRCPTPVSSAPVGLLACERAVAANARVLRLARTALGTWRLHVHDMEMLRTGMMSGAQASQVWVQSWHEGQDEIARYHAAVKTSVAHQCT